MRLLREEIAIYKSLNCFDLGVIHLPLWMCTKWQFRIGGSQPFADPQLQRHRSKGRPILWMTRRHMEIGEYTMCLVAKEHNYASKSSFSPMFLLSLLDPYPSLGSRIGGKCYRSLA